MKVAIIEPSFDILTPSDEIGEYPRRIEQAARLCYRSEPGGDPEGFVRARIAQGHESVIEHCALSVRFVMSRAAANQLVRHRLASYTQESLRYVRPDVLEVVKHDFGDGPRREVFAKAVIAVAECYELLIDMGARREDARSVLPLCTATRILVTANLREWRHILKVRTDRHAQAELRGLMLGLQGELQALLPCVFGEGV